MVRTMRFRLSEKTLHFKRPFVSSRWSLTERRVMYLEAFANDELIGRGESAPLEAFGTELYLAAHEALTSLTEKELPLPKSIDDIRTLMSAMEEFRDTPTARFALETALLDVVARRQSVPLFRLLNEASSEAPIPVNAVIVSDTIDVMVEEACKYVRQGFTCLKVKVGRIDLHRDVECVKRIRSAVGDDILLRLDANGAWNYEQASEALSSFEQYQIEYIEQPVPSSDYDSLERLARESPIPLAADEAIKSEADAMELLRRHAASVFILKPSAMGGLLPCIQIAEAAQSNGVDIVMTSLLESRVARTAIAHLALALRPITTRHHGLATGALFTEPDEGRHIGRGFLKVPLLADRIVA